MSEMVDKATAAVLAEAYKTAGLKITVGVARSIARSVVKEIRKPTDAMKQAGFELTGDPCWPEDVGRAWEAMIDEALK